ncbi:cyclopropane-fatty-acyl-phospholipid synthase family protein [Sphingomonas sp.]|uniref:SAM-dependent methyltransferase n=1 Tax=Sphingomonas sp. TaxID=28214 RepID=UPI0025F5A45B|nr:cyclopropane-fatty-acyl-phospholipid synthase family protein [Sphingomonas sp.]MBV9527443.1 class I SAM-dependent methyltransferase [Sphingomonas sp.]
MASRGQHLVHGDRGFATGGGLVARLLAPAFASVLDRIDRRLVQGGIEATLPDGTARRIGFRAPGPMAVVRLNSWMSLVRLATSGSVGWYKAWALGEWSSPDPVAIFELFSSNAVALGDTGRAKGPFRWMNALAHRLRDNAPGKARANIAAHYDLGNDFYAAWLDATMTYSSALFSPVPLAGGEEVRSTEGEGLSVRDKPSPSPSRKREGSLEAAQLRKVNALLDRLDLKPGQRLLEIGCGWGTLAMEAARRGAEVVGLTLSTEQKAWAERKIADQGLADRIEIRLQDYRETDERFDAIASVEMVEAVGQRWWGAYLDSIARNLKPGRRAALQFISMDDRLFDRYARNPDFIQTYIFPGGLLLDEPQFEALAAERGLTWHDREGFGGDYAETLRLWRRRYDAAVAEGRLSDFAEEFHDLWRYYLMYCEGGFRGGAIDVAQVTLGKADRTP